MNISDIHEFYNWIINKTQGGWYPPEEIDNSLDFAQMSVYNDDYLEYGASQRLNDSLAPFKKPFTFTNATTSGGLIDVPDDYVHLLTVIPQVFDPVRGVKNVPCPILNEVEKQARDVSQLFPPTTSRPYAMITTNWNIQLYPKVPQAGELFYLRRPVKPKLVYTVISGRVIVPKPVPPSVDLEWADKDQLRIIVMALNMAGINLSEQDIIAWTQNKTNLDVMSKNKL